MPVSILQLLGGSSANTDRKATLTGFGELEDTYRVLSKDSNQDRQAGAINEGKASKFYDSILSGDPAAVAAAVAPETNAARKTGQTELKSLSSFGNRSGGTTQAGAQVNEKGRGDVIDAILRARTGSAAKLGDIGSTQSGRAFSEKEGAGTAATSLTSLASSARVADYQIHQDAAKQWADLFTQVLKAVPGLPG